MPGLPWLLIKGAFKMTAKGAAVTFSSTVFSCTLACYIEIGAHRMVYHYFPQKYATVDYANGLTQEQLDAVRLHSIEYQEASRPFAEKEQDPMEERLLDDSASPDSKKVIGLSTSSRDVFWKEEKRPSESSTLLALTQMALPSNDIMACAMTG